MPSELENSVRAAAEKVAEYVADAATMTVETSYVSITGGAAAGFEQARPAARTIIKLDGDCSAVIPVRTDADGNPEIDRSLFEIHERNVSAAIEYRAKILNSMLGVLTPPSGGGRRF